MRRSLEAPIPIHGEFPDVMIRLGESTDLPMLAEVLGAKKAGRFARRLQDGQVLFLGFIGGVFYGYMWVATSSYHERCHNLYIPLNDEEIYQFDGWVRPEKRGRELAHLSLVYVYKYFLARGRRQSLVYCQNDPQRAAYKMHLRLGFEPLALIRYRRILFFKKCRFLPIKGDS